MASEFTAAQRRQAAASAVGRRNAGQKRFIRDTADEWLISPTTLQNWIREFHPEPAADPLPDLRPAAAARQPTPYPLRTLLWCGQCWQPMLGGWHGTDRVYLCPEPCTRRTPITATDIHEAVLTAVARSVPAVRKTGSVASDIYGVPGFLYRIIVGLHSGDLRLGWRPGGYDTAAVRRHAAPWLPPLRGTDARAGVSV